MRPVEQNLAQETHKFDSHKANNTNKNNPNRKILGSRSKPTPSKWDDAQKWLAGLSSGGDRNHGKNNPRNSNADDRRLLNSASQRGRESTSSVDLALYEDISLAITNAQDEGETKKMDCGESLRRMSKPLEESPLEINEVNLRDMGTEMTPIASLEPSRATTPIRVTTPASTSPIESRTSSPGRFQQGILSNESNQIGARNLERKNEVLLFSGGNGNGWTDRGEEDAEGRKVVASNHADQVKIPSCLDSRALAWDEAERAKYMARFKREEVKIQAWENHEKRKAEMDMKRIEVKAERMKSRAQEKLANKLAATRRIAEEKRANAEAKLNEQAMRTAERADYIRRTGHMPFYFNISIKLPSFCG